MQLPHVVSASHEATNIHTHTITYYCTCTVPYTVPYTHACHLHVHHKNDLIEQKEYVWEVVRYLLFPFKVNFIPSPLSSLSLSPSPAPIAAVNTYNSHTEIKYSMKKRERERERERGIEREGKREKYACYAKWSLPWGYTVIVSHTPHPIEI